MNKTKKAASLSNGSGITAREESYRMAKLLRAGNRELDRQLNTKKTKRTR